MEELWMMWTTWLDAGAPVVESPQGLRCAECDALLASAAEGAPRHRCPERTTAEDDLWEDLSPEPGPPFPEFGETAVAEDEP